MEQARSRMSAQDEQGAGAGGVSRGGAAAPAGEKDAANAVSTDAVKSPERALADASGTDGALLPPGTGPSEADASRVGPADADATQTKSESSVGHEPVGLQRESGDRHQVSRDGVPAAGMHARADLGFPHPMPSLHDEERLEDVGLRVVLSECLCLCVSVCVGVCVCVCVCVFMPQTRTFCPSGLWSDAGMTRC